ncbi:MAG: GNAT family N-acetyltransferase [Bacteroidetes bacterium]|nr:GNAT family N-acetyltransferase [Bacteroidota bacterium]
MNNAVISLHATNPNDSVVISIMADRIWRSHYIPIIGEKQVEYMLEKMYSEKSLREQMGEGQQFFLAKSNEKNVGYVSISKRNASEFFMHKFYMEMNEQGKGFGKKIFSELLLLFPELKSMRLQVNRMNYKSINFYFRLGFVIEEAKSFDIGNGFFMDDFVMVFKKI